MGDYSDSETGFNSGDGLPNDQLDHLFKKNLPNPDEPDQCHYARVGYGNEIYCKIREIPVDGIMELRKCNRKCNGV